MSTIYVPIDFTNLSEVIPEGDDILYSTICRVEIIGISYKQKRKHKSHVLITNSGFAITNSLRKSNLELNFYPWNNINYWKKRFFKNRFASVKYRTAGRLKCKVSYDSRFEDKASFNKRRSTFGIYCKELWLKNNQ
ncbi:hypothetical protein LCGC14_1784560 [marine sediment metagenome]|uniref:Uncharacterized protein n=1 Tax=marine sediment metagenome TaxID=412755 RepID=A0A0F9GUH7_9ZZZZ